MMESMLKLYAVMIYFRRYRFRCCTGFFCSSECFKSHETCPSTISGTVSNVQTPSRPWIRSDNFDLDLDESEVVPEDTLLLLASQNSLKTRLSDPLIQKLLSKLDNSRDRRYTFSKMYDSNDAFRSFVDEVAGLVDFKSDT